MSAGHAVVATLVGLLAVGALLLSLVIVFCDLEDLPYEFEEDGDE